MKACKLGEIVWDSNKIECCDKGQQIPNFLIFPTVNEGFKEKLFSNRIYNKQVGNFVFSVDLDKIRTIASLRRYFEFHKDKARNVIF